MYSKFLRIILLCALFDLSHRFVSAFDINLMQQLFVYKNKRLSDSTLYDYEVESDINNSNHCGGNITSGPGTIKVNLANNPHCIWKVCAPQDHHVYLYTIKISYTVLKEKKNESIVVDIFDGVRERSSALLHRIEPLNPNIPRKIENIIDNAISSGQCMKIDLKNNLVKRWIYEYNVELSEVDIEYYFIDDQDYKQTN